MGCSLSNFNHMCVDIYIYIYELSMSIMFKKVHIYIYIYIYLQIYLYICASELILGKVLHTAVLSCRIDTQSLSFHPLLAAV